MTSEWNIVWRILLQYAWSWWTAWVSDTYTVPFKKSAKITAIFVTNVHATDIKTYNINIIPRWWSLSNTNSIAKLVQIQPGYASDSYLWIDVPLNEWDKITCTGSSCSFTIMWYEYPSITQQQIDPFAWLLEENA